MKKRPSTGDYCVALFKVKSDAKETSELWNLYMGEEIYYVKELENGGVAV